MSLPDERSPLTSFLQEEMSDYLSQTLTDVLERLPPIARLRLLAFMHLLESPETLQASLEIKPSGYLKLSLEALVAPRRSNQH